MAELLLQVPDFPRAQDSRKRRVLAQPAAFFVIGNQKSANLLQRAAQNLPPFGIAPHERSGISIQAAPPIKVFLRDPEQGRLLKQPLRGAATHLQTDRVE